MPMYIHDEPNLYLTADDRVVAAGDPRAATLLVATGGQLAPDVAARYGLPRGGQAARAAAPRALAPGERLEDATIVRAGDLPPDTLVIAVGAVEERPDVAEPGEQIDGQGLGPAIERADAGDTEADEAAAQADEPDEKGKAAKPNKAKGVPTNKAG